MRFKSTIFYSLFLISINLFAQPGGGGDPGGGEPVPIHGIGLLIIVGAILGVKKILNLKRLESN